MHTIKEMDTASGELVDLDGLSVAELKALLSVAELKALLREQHAALQEKYAQLVVKDALLRSYTVEIEALKLQILKLRQMQFGKRSENRAREIEQLELWVEELEAAATKRSSVLAEHDGELKHLGEDVCEMLELEPVRFKVIRHVRPKLACAGCDTIVQEPAPTRPIERGLAGPGLLARVLVGKYSDHVPLHRQAEIYAREGVELDRTLLALWVGSVSALLTPLTDALRAHAFATDVVHADDTPIPVLAPGRGKTKTGRLWSYVRDDRPAAGEIAPAVWFAYSPDRKGEHPQRHLEDFSGILQADGYAGFTKIYDGGQVFEAACWAHVRRKFVDLHELHKSPMAAQTLERIGALYAIEQKLRGRPPHERRAARQEYSRPLLDAMKAWLEQTLGTLSQKSATAKAIRYALRRWDALGRYCDKWRIEIDNNAAERALRLGARIICSPAAMQAVIELRQSTACWGSAKLNGHNPEAFLREVIARIAEHPITRINELLPWHLQATHTNPLTGNGATPKLPP
jgi:transposase